MDATDRHVRGRGVRRRLRGGRAGRTRGRRAATGARVAALLGCVAMAGCANVRVESELAAGAEPSRFATYVQAPPVDGAPRTLGHGKLIADHVEAEIDRVLAAKGYREAPRDEAGMVVTFQVDAAWSVRLQNAADPDADYLVPENVLDGQIRFDVYEAGTMTPLWSGVGHMEISKGTDAKWAAGKIVEAVFEEFPSRPGASPQAQRPVPAQEPAG